jgi:hypothetical protein
MVLKSWRNKEKNSKIDFFKVSTGTKCSKMVISQNRFWNMPANGTHP